jgi:hypothetical protein
MLKKFISFVHAALSTFGKRGALLVKRPSEGSGRPEPGEGRLSFPDSDVSRFTFHERRAAVLLAAFVFVGLAACERTPDQAPEAKKAVVADRLV